MGAVVQHATVPSAREMRAEAVGASAVVQQATVPSAREMRDEAMGAVCVACNCSTVTVFYLELRAAVREH